MWVVSVRFECELIDIWLIINMLISLWNVEQKEGEHEIRYLLFRLSFVFNVFL